MSNYKVQHNAEIKSWKEQKRALRRNIRSKLKLAISERIDIEDLELPETPKSLKREKDQIEQVSQEEF